jgi:hypothetical protein
VVGSSSGYTSGGGYLNFDCVADEHDGGTVFNNSSLNILGGSGGLIQGDQSDCDPPSAIDVYVDSDEAHVFKTMTAVAGVSATTFQHTRSQVAVELDAGASNSFYSSGNDRITIRNGTGSADHVWGPWGQFLMAHEYAHALHEKGLNGNAASGNCPSPHFIDGAYNLQCAFSEGFANYFGHVFDGTFFGGNIETNSYYSGGDGSVVEGAVAAFLFDMSDGANETHDAMAYPHSYVAELVKSCEVHGDQVDGVDFFVYCAEQQVDGTAESYFPRSTSTSSSVSEGASEPGSWSVSDIRSGWLENLFGN